LDNSNDNAKRLDALRQDYQSVFAGPKGEAVLKDLAQYCGVGRDLFNPDALCMARNTGLRAALLRIQNMMNVTDQQIWDLFNG
jgi:hypothetical protein